MRCSFLLLAVLPSIFAQSASTSSVVSPTPDDSENIAYLGNQCGGLEFTGPTKCEAGSYCAFMDADFSLCLPIEILPPDSTISSPSATSTPAVTYLADGEICAGKRFNRYQYSTLVSCLSGSKCDYQTDEVSFCLPAATSILSPRSVCTLITKENYAIVPRCPSGHSCKTNGKSDPLCVPIKAKLGEQCAGPADYVGPTICSTDEVANPVCQYTDGNVPVCARPYYEIQKGDQCAGTAFSRDLLRCTDGTVCTEIDPTISVCLPPKSSQTVPEGFRCHDRIKCDPGLTCLPNSFSGPPYSINRCVLECVKPSLQCFAKSWPAAKKCCSGTCKMFYNGLYGQCVSP